MPPEEQQAGPLPQINYAGRPWQLLAQPLHSITLKFEDVVYKIKSPAKAPILSCFPMVGEAKEQTILAGITGIVRPGEILAMLGPSGSGKTTLLTALAGRLRDHAHGSALTGSITYNGLPFSGAVRRRIGFVFQDDVLYPHLTVSETLLFTALLRLPSTLTPVEKAAHVKAVVEELGLTKCCNSIVGGALVRGLSGGERKRVSIGQEMLVNPSLLLLDEPTSGLDSTTAARIVSTLQRLAKGGRTVVTTIHQPSSRLFHMFNSVVVLCEGNAIYSGKAAEAMGYFSSIGFQPSMAMNPADFLLDLANGVGPEPNTNSSMSNVANFGGGGWGEVHLHDQQHSLTNNTLTTAAANSAILIKSTLIQSYNKNLALELKAELNHLNSTTLISSKDQLEEEAILSSHVLIPLGKQRANSISTSKCSCGSDDGSWCTSWWQQFKVLLLRSLKERRHESFSGLKIFQVISVSILAGLMWWSSQISHLQDQVGLLFFFSIFWGFFPLYNAVFIFPQERSMLIKERNSGMYRLSSYFLARIVGDLPMELVLPIIFVSITYWMGGLKPTGLAFLHTLFVVLLNVLVAQGFGLALGAVVMDVKKGATMASVLMLTFLLAGGYYVQHIPDFVSWMKYLSYSYYCYKLLLGAQYSNEDYYVCGGGSSSSVPHSNVVMCKVADYPAIKHVGLDHMGLDLVMLTLMLIGFRFVAYAALRMGRATRSS